MNNRKKLIATGICLLISALSTLSIMAISFILMVFESGEDGMRKCFFDTMYFESTTNTNGTVSMMFGLTGEVMPILFTFLVIFLICLVFQTSYTKLLAYRENLIKENSKYEK